MSIYENIFFMYYIQIISLFIGLFDNLLATWYGLHFQGTCMKRKRHKPPGLPSGEILASSTYTRLRRDIIEGALAPSSKLRMRQLCDRL